MKIKLCAFSDEAAAALSDQIQALKRNNIYYIELRGVDGKNIKDLTKAEAANYAVRLKENGIKVWSIGSPIGKVDIDVDIDVYIKTVRHIYELAQIFECDKIRVFSFFNAYDTIGLVVEYMRRLVGLAAEYGLTLYHENEKAIYGDTAARVAEVLDNVKGLKSIYDPANFIQVGQDVDAALENLFCRTDYFHIKDVVKKTEQLVPAGDGDGKIDKILDRLDRDTVLTLEPHLKVFDGYTAIDGHVMKGKREYGSSGEAFDTAAQALKKLLKQAGYSETTDKGENVWTRG